MVNGTQMGAAGNGSFNVTAPQVDSAYHLRMALTITHLTLVCIGTVNLLVILLILIRPRYMRSITNVYMIGLCLADFIYLANLTLVAATQLKDKSWSFGGFACTVYHGSETTGKYASVLFVVLLAADRYCAMCKASWCARYRNYRTAITASVIAWVVAFLFASPLYLNAVTTLARFKKNGDPIIACIANWPSTSSAQWYVCISGVCIFLAPLALIVFCYYHILNKLREAVIGSKRLRRASSTRAPYHRVTRLVLWVVIFHVVCWTPFWLFNLFSTIFRVRFTTQFERIIINIVHLFPYVNCALNPLLYAAHAENFRLALRSLFGCLPPGMEDSTRAKSNRSVAYRNTNYTTAAILPVNGSEASVSVFKDQSLLVRATDYPARSLSDSNAPAAQTARQNALEVIANSRIRSSSGGISRSFKARRSPPDPANWRKYSELEPRQCNNNIHIPQREEENSVFLDSPPTPKTPLLEGEAMLFENGHHLIVFPSLPLDSDSDIRL